MMEIIAWGAGKVINPIWLCHKFYTCGQLWCRVGGILYIRKLYAVDCFDFRTSCPEEIRIQMHNGKDGKCRKDGKDGKDGGLFGKSTGAGNTSHNTDE